MISLTTLNIGMKEDGMDVEVIEYHPELLRSHESLYKRKIPLANVEEKDLHYFDFIGQNECRKAVVGLFGFGGAGKTSLIKLLGGKSVIKGAGPFFTTETLYEIERECTIHIHPTIAFFQRKSGASCIMTLLDTPGHSDLTPETTKVIECIDIAVVVFDICRDLSLQYELIFNAIEASKKPLIIVLNKTDLIGSDSASSIKKKIEHLRSAVEERICPRGWFTASSKYGSLTRINAGVHESNEKPEDVLNELLEEIFCLEPTKHNYNDEERLGEFLWVEGAILFGFVPKADFNVGSTIKVYGTDLVAEKLYIPFPGCLVETRAVKANVGVLVKFQEGLLRKITPPNSQKILGRAIKKVSEDKGLARTNPELLEVVDPVIRVQVSPSDEDIFLREAWKLRLIYQGLKIDKKSLYGNGELFMDAVLYDLRNKLNVEFQVLSVSSNLKEIFKDSFREVVETGKGLLTVEGGITRGIDEDRKFSGYIEKRILGEGPLIKEPFSHSYLAISSEPLELDFECFRKIEDSVAKHAAILEPVYLVEIVYASEAEDLVNEMVSSSSGEVIYQGSFPFSMLKNILCYIPVPESFGFETDLRVYSCSKADCIKIPFYWRPVSDKSRATSLIRFMRKTKRFELQGS